MTAVHLDLIPATVETPQGKYEMARVVYATDDHGVASAHVFLSHDGRTVTLATSAEVPVVPLVNNWPYVLTTADGEAWTISRGTGCGCGSPLKRARLADLLAVVAAS